MRLQSPSRYSSRMASPRTSTLRCLKSPTYAARGSVSSLRVIVYILVGSGSPALELSRRPLTEQRTLRGGKNRVRATSPVTGDNYRHRVWHVSVRPRESQRFRRL